MEFLTHNQDWLFIAGGLVGLFLGGEGLVKGAVSIADRLRLPKLLVGLTIIGFGTSMPELLVCLKAVQAGAADVAIGNVVGSNIANILLILGVGALIRPMSTRSQGTGRDAIVMVAATCAFVYLALQGGIRQTEGVVMTAMLLGYILLVFVVDRRKPKVPLEEPEKRLTPATALLFIAGGLAALIFGADALVRGATSIATAYGVPQSIIGLTLVAIGTSLPELTVSVISAARGQNELALGNVLGSNLFNILAVLGITAGLVPFAIDPKFLGVDIPLMAAAAVGLCLLILLQPKLGRLVGVFSLLVYGGYMTWLALGIPALA